MLAGVILGGHAMAAKRPLIESEVFDHDLAAVQYLDRETVPVKEGHAGKRRIVYGQRGHLASMPKPFERDLEYVELHPCAVFKRNLGGSQRWQGKP